MRKVKIERTKDLKKRTDERVSKMKAHFAQEPVVKVFENTEKYDQIIAQVGIPFIALCEHHRCSFEGVCHIAYLSGKYITGLSKLARVMEYYLNPTVETIQEKATHQILNHLKETLKPQGVMVVIEARHSCIAYRGVKKPSLTITSAVSGIFAITGNDVKSEFLSLINGNRL